MLPITIHILPARVKGKEYGSVVRVPVTCPLPIHNIANPAFLGHATFEGPGECLVIVLAHNIGKANLVRMTEAIPVVSWYGTVNVRWAHKRLKTHPDKWRGLLIYLPTAEKRAADATTAYFMTWKFINADIQLLAIPVGGAP